MIELILGTKIPDLKEVAIGVGKLLNLEFDEHDSSYKGQYFLAKRDDCNYQIIQNELADYEDIPEEEKEYFWQIRILLTCLSRRRVRLSSTGISTRSCYWHLSVGSFPLKNTWAMG